MDIYIYIYGIYIYISVVGMQGRSYLAWTKSRSKFKHRLGLYTAAKSEIKLYYSTLVQTNVSPLQELARSCCSIPFSLINEACRIWMRRVAYECGVSNMNAACRIRSVACKNTTPSSTWPRKRVHWFRILFRLTTYLSASLDVFIPSNGFIPGPFCFWASFMSIAWRWAYTYTYIYLQKSYT